MKGYMAGIAAAFLSMLLFVSGAAAQESMRLYVQPGALEKGEIQRAISLLNEGEAQWTLIEDEKALRELVLAGVAPDLAICSPAEARPWAKEGMLQALQTHIDSQQRMQRQVLAQCVYNEALFMAPLIARHRQMAVNGRLMDAMGLGYMMDSQAYPVWYPAQFYQILEEFLIYDAAAMDIWPAEPENGAPLEALTQAIYGGMLLDGEGAEYLADSAALCAGMQWLADAVEDGMIGYCQTREEALARFLDGETAIFIDWTKELEKQLEQSATLPDISVRPYPSALGLPVRAFELTGVCAFSSGDEEKDARLARACVRLHEGAQDVLGPRGIWQDGAVWLPALEADDAGATLRSLFAAALQDVLTGKQQADAALARVQAAMEALAQTK